jgi:hypothetical protein
MKYANTNNQQQLNSNNSIQSYSSTRKVNVMKRLVLLLVITFFVGFAGIQSTPVTEASAPTISDGCDLVCGEPFIDPNDGRCYQMCCPADDMCKRACELRPCLK